MIRRVRDIRKNLDTIDWKKQFNNGISLLGGEIFYVKDKEVQDEFMLLVEDIIEKMGQFYNDKNDNFLLSNSKFIMEGLRKMNEKLTFTELEIYNNIGTDLIIDYPLKPLQTNNEEGQSSQPQTQGNNVETEGSMGNNNNSVETGQKGKSYSLDDIIDAFSNYMTLGPPNVLNYKA